jgi:hypothetical protein
MKVCAMDLLKENTLRRSPRAHSIICVWPSSSSISGYVYYVYFIDDYFCKTWVYFLKSKDEVFNKFKEFKALIENLSERKIKILR